jgi:hypothetical protein
MTVERLPNGHLLVPKRAVDEKTGTIGDGLVEIGPGDPEYEAWVRYLERLDCLGDRTTQPGPRDV